MAGVIAMEPLRVNTAGNDCICLRTIASGLAGTNTKTVSLTA